ncbi:MAG: sialate O-acetylesterase [Opitutaceae bacterium]|jgi:sialate O-acetylesterase
MRSPAARTFSAWIIAVWLVGSIATPLSALELPEVFSDHLVLQRGKSVAVWGTAKPGEKVSVAFAGRETVGRTEPDGRWLVWLDPLAANASGADLTVSGSSGARRVLRDVVVGEVWLAGGQSNMQASFFNLQHDNSPEASPLPESCDYPGIRFFTVPTRTNPVPADPTLAWKPATSATVLHFSAVAFYFARDLHRRLGVPVGILSCSWGGTYAESWMPPGPLLDDPLLAPILQRYASAVAQWSVPGAYDEAVRDYRTRYAAWHRDLEAWRRRTPGAARPGLSPEEPVGNRYYRRPCGLYESMLSPLAPFGLAGFIFYQGEANASDGRGWQYRFLLEKLVAAWRADFRQGPLPFLYVQLPPLATRESWCDLRDSQLAALRRIPNAGMAVIADDTSNRLHPPDKRPAAERLARWARGLVYGERDLTPCGPLYRSAHLENDALVIEFDHTAAGLELRPAAPGAAPAFEVCGEDRVFHPARAEIGSDGRLRLSSQTVPEPVSARYAWGNTFTAGLFNTEQLPAAPFRTDDFALQTQDAR